MISPSTITLMLCCFLCQVALGGDPNAFKITVKKSEDKVVVEQAVDKSTFAIKSPSGIGNVTIERIDDHWEEHVVLRLHLKGLESLRIFNGKTALSAAVSSHSDQQHARLWKDKQENELLDDKHELWMEIRSVGSDGKASSSIPLRDGYFEFELPKAFLDENPKSITIHWIDFFREYHLTSLDASFRIPIEEQPSASPCF